LVAVLKRKPGDVCFYIQGFMSEGRAADEFFFILEKKNKYMWGGFQSVSCTISTTLSQTVEMNHLNIEAREVTFTCASWR